MNTAEWVLALELHVLIGIAGTIFATVFLRIPLRTVLFAGLLCNSIPLARPPGFQTPMYACDMLVPFLAIVALMRFGRVKSRLALVATVTLLAWPVFSTFLNVLLGIDYFTWVTFLYRRFGCLAFFLVGASAAHSEDKTREFLDACAVFWLGLTAAGIGQYMGLFSVDFVADAGSRNLVITESFKAQRGFMGLVRGSVGIWGATFATFCVSQMFLSQRPGILRLTLYGATVAMTYTVVLFSGSRTGALACLAGLGFICFHVALRIKRVALVRILVFALAAGGLLAYLLSPALHVIGERFRQAQSVGVVSAAAGRFETQLEAIRILTQDPRAGAIGLGGGLTNFKFLVGGLSHPHNEIIQVAWETGLPGAVIYGVFLILIFVGVRTRNHESVDALGIAGQGFLIAGTVCGLSVGYIMITSTRLATFGMLMFYIFGLLLSRVYVRRDQTLNTNAPGPSAPPHPYPHLVKTFPGQFQPRY